MTDLAPIVLFVYNRPWHTRQTLEALSKADLADQSHLIIFSDGPKIEDDSGKVEEVRALIREQIWCKSVEIRESKKNKGLAASIIEGVTEIVNKYGKIIVLEDDLVCRTQFLEYMNYYLDAAFNDKEVVQVSGYMFGNINVLKKVPFKINLTTTWGWGIWKDRWNQISFNSLSLIERCILRVNKYSFNLNSSYDYYAMKIKKDANQVESWGIDLWYYAFKNKYMTIFPPSTLVYNKGLDGSGTNKGVRIIYSEKESSTIEILKYEYVEVRNEIKNKISIKLKLNELVFV